MAYKKFGEISNDLQIGALELSKLSGLNELLPQPDEAALNKYKERTEFRAKLVGHLQQTSTGSLAEASDFVEFLKAALRTDSTYVDAEAQTQIDVGTDAGDDPTFACYGGIMGDTFKNFRAEISDSLNRLFEGITNASLYQAGFGKTRNLQGEPFLYTQEAFCFGINYGITVSDGREI